MEIVINSVQEVWVRSESDPDVWYRVNGEEATCQCKGFEYRGGCKHLKEVARELKKRGLLEKKEARQVHRGSAEPTEKRQRSVNTNVAANCPQLYTARYQSQGVLASGSVVPVCTSLGKPKFPLQYRLQHEVSLMKPDRRMMQMEWEDYVPAYLNKLEHMGVEKLANVFYSISQSNGGKPLALLCYEDLMKGNRCHRRLFADWWEKKTGMQVPELMPDGDCCTTSDMPSQYPGDANQETLL